MNITQKLKLTKNYESYSVGFMNRIKPGLFSEMRKMGFAYLTFKQDEWTVCREVVTITESGNAALKTALVIKSATDKSMGTAWNMLLNFTEMFGYNKELAKLYSDKEKTVKHIVSDGAVAGLVPELPLC
ncbi:MAG: hypothetical protein U9N85_01260 [Bacteroidota bacterium]|nr:hypothetical protein [Bacteroidota bacterium]